MKKKIVILTSFVTISAQEPSQKEVLKTSIEQATSSEESLPQTSNSWQDKKGTSSKIRRFLACCYWCTKDPEAPVLITKTNSVSNQSKASYNSLGYSVQEKPKKVTRSECKETLV